MGTPTDSTTSPEVQVRRAGSADDYRACQSAQRRAWGIADAADLVPVATMAGAQHHGGLVLGAFLPSGEAVGLSFAFLGRTDGRLCLYSQLTGVVPGYQGRGVGARLKAAQREAARAEGVPCIAWAFDPLQAGNARFNLGKLGATAARYVENMYGPRTDALNRDTPTDRLIAVWETEPTPTAPAGRPGECPPILRFVDHPGGPPAPVFDGLPAAPAGLRLEIPGEIVRLRAEAPDLAGRWASAVRGAFLAAFAAGYRAVGVDSEEAEGGRRHYYRLEPRGPGTPFP